MPSTTAGTTKYLREDCTWQVPPNTVYTHPTTAGNKHLPAGGASGNILLWSAAGTGAWGAPPLPSSAAPKPTSSNAVGRWYHVDTSVSTGKYTLPSGGTWAYYLATNAVSKSFVGVAAGGAQVDIGNLTIVHGLLWRVA